MTAINASASSFFKGNGFLVTGDDTTLHGNTATHNLRDGFNLSGSDDNRLIGNTASKNELRGFHLQGGSNNRIISNTADGSVFLGTSPKPDAQRQ